MNFICLFLVVKNLIKEIENGAYICAASFYCLLLVLLLFTHNNNLCISKSKFYIFQLYFRAEENIKVSFLGFLYIIHSFFNFDTKKNTPLVILLYFIVYFALTLTIFKIKSDKHVRHQAGKFHKCNYMQNYVSTPRKKTALEQRSFQIKLA